MRGGEREARGGSDIGDPAHLLCLPRLKIPLLKEIHKKTANKVLCALITVLL